MQPTPAIKPSILVSIPQYLLDQSSDPNSNNTKDNNHVHKNDNNYNKINNSTSVTVATSTTTNSSSSSFLNENSKSVSVVLQDNNNTNSDKLNNMQENSNFSNNNIYNMYSTLDQFSNIRDCKEADKEEDKVMEQTEVDSMLRPRQEAPTTRKLSNTKPIYYNDSNYAVANYLLNSSFYTSTLNNNNHNFNNIFKTINNYKINDACYNYNSPGTIRTSAKKPPFPPRSHIILPIPTTQPAPTLDNRHVLCQNNYEADNYKSYDEHESKYLKHNSMAKEKNDLNEKVQLVHNFYNFNT